MSLAIARRPFGNNSGTTFGANLWQPCDNFMTTFQSHWDNFGKASRQLFDSFETSLRQLWIIIGTSLRQLEENFETTLGPYGGHVVTFGGAQLCPMGSIWPFLLCTCAESLSLSRQLHSFPVGALKFVQEKTSRTRVRKTAWGKRKVRERRWGLLNPTFKSYNPNYTTFY